MKLSIQKLNLIRFRNHEHFQLNTEIKDLLMASNPDLLQIRPQFDAYMQLFEREDEALKKIVKSSLTEEIHEADKRRDTTFLGLIATNKAAYRHFDAEVTASAKRLQILFDTYGNLAKMPLNEGTSAIYNMLQELNGNYAGDVEKVGLKAWVQELENNNNTLGVLVKNRYEEAADKSDIKVKEIRTELDTTLHDLVDRIEALYLLEGNEIHAVFIRKVNIITEKYKNIIAQRYGRLAAKKEGK